MGRSLTVPGNEPPGSFRHSASSSTVRVFWKDGRMHHQVEERGLTADYPIAYSIGAGAVGRSYLIEQDGRFFQSPASYYTAHSEWNVSPGYEPEKILDFSRSITSDCLVCHTGAVKKNATNTELIPISCERCHGNGENHRLHPYPGTIVNPAKLPLRERDSVCEQCHLEGATVVLNPGKYWWDFRPGEALENVESHYVYRTPNAVQISIAAVSQAEQLALSACARGSRGKLWCGTCHDPHGPSVDRKQQIRQVCGSCHASSQLAATHTPEQQDCVACHLPRRQAADVSHAAITDHRIARRPANVAEAKAGKVLEGWHEPKPELAQRNLGLALFYSARREQSVQEFQRAFQLLTTLPPGSQDAAVSAAEGYMLLGIGRAAKATECFEKAVREDPASAEYWLDLGIAQENSGENDLAIQALRRSIKEDPYDYRPYKALARLYTGVHQPNERDSVIADFLRLVPQSVAIRLERP